MTRKTNTYKGRQYHYYYCRTTKKRGCTNSAMLKEEELVACVTGSVKSQVANVASLESVLAGSDAQRTINALAARYNAQIADNEAQLAKITGFKSTLYENLINGVLTKEDYKNLKTKYVADETRLREAIEKLQGELAEALSGKGERLRWMEHFRRFEILAELDRRVVANLIHSIRVLGKNELQITFNYQDEYENALDLLAREEVAA
jgi:hypothetical protein